ncbi:MAG: carboxypeptidase-like regulatory domain-containing protein [Prevotellaceae bacterium]|nr:carboxypeptidase-like regulatory domain-containing protein [Prevotellaceae bacterium]
MKHIIPQYITLLLLFFVASSLHAQVTGKVIDSKTREPLDYVNVFYEGKNTGEQTDENGRFVIKEDSTWKELTISSMGYQTQKIKLKDFGRNKDITVRLVPDAKTLSGVTVSAKKARYSRKNNPAVELMKKVIANKKNSDLHSRDFFTYTKYEKLTFSLNEVSDKVFDENEYKRFAFLKDHVETSPQTGKLILPLTVDETLSEVYYRKNPKSEKTVIKGESNKGITELVNTGEILTTTLKDVFTEVDIYENECRLLQYPFKSPIADNAISFYRYYLQDTIFIGQDKVVDVGFLPNNQQDFGFSGHLFIRLDPDSTFQVKRVELSIPRRSDVNFVENMLIAQDFTELENGDRFVSNNDMLVEMQIVNTSLGKYNVQRVSRITDVSFDEIPRSLFKNIKGNTFREPDANMQDESFWKNYRQVELSSSEGKMDSFLDRLTHIKGFKYVLFGFKALVENFVETSDSLQTNYVDIGPVNTMISGNDYDGLRLRISALTTANLSPHLFGSGYVAYGTKTKNIYWRGQLTYSFNKKAYLPREYPQHNLTVYWLDDIVSPFDKFMPTDKDNMFTALHASKVDQYNHTKELRIDYTREFEDGLKLNAQFTRTHNKAVDALFYQPLDGVGTPMNDPTHWIPSITTTEFKIGVSYEPNVTYINTKQRRVKVNHDAPILSLSHTRGINGFLGGEYNYNVTEAGIYKRLWLGKFGKLDIDIKAGAQWNKVPFPLLIHPAANTSYIIEDYTFYLISNLEFLNDRYASMLTEWDLNGWLFNRIPLLKKLKWRELIGVNVLWGKLTDKNNPAASNYSDNNLFYFPGHFLSDGTYEQNTVCMNARRPYIEWRVGIHNIFKLIEIDYVRRFNYLNDPNTNKWGIRLKARMTF